MDEKNLCKKEKIALGLEFMQRIMVQCAIWYAQVRDKFGMERVLEIMDQAWQKSSQIQMKKLSKVFGFEMEGGLPAVLIQE